MQFVETEPKASVGALARRGLSPSNAWFLSGNRGIGLVFGAEAHVGLTPRRSPLARRKTIIPTRFAVNQIPK